MEGKIVREARAGSFESNDLLVYVKPSDELNVKINSVVSDMFYDSIKDTVLETLNEMEVDKIEISIDDRGALPFAIKARVRTAIKRGMKNEI